MIPSRVVRVARAGVRTLVQIARREEFFGDEARKVAIIGAGAVGAATLAEVIRTFPAEPLNLVLYNREPISAAVAHASDIAGQLHISRYLPGAAVASKDVEDHIRLKVTSDRDYLEGSDVVVFAAGVSAAKIKSDRREDALPLVAGLIEDYAETIKKSSPKSMVVMITNPVDISTWLMQSYTGFSPDKVIGTGTEIDAERFRRFLREGLREVDIFPKTIDAEVIGGHSDAEMIVPVSGIKLDGVPLSKQGKEVDSVVAKTMQRMMGEGFGIVRDRGYGASMEPAAILASIARSYLYGEKPISLSASYVLTGRESFHGIGQTCMSVPVSVSKGRITMNPDMVPLLTSDEMTRLQSVALAHRNLFNAAKNTSSTILAESLIKIATDNPSLFFEVVDSKAMPNVEVRIKEEHLKLPEILRSSLLEVFVEKSEKLGVSGCVVNSDNKSLSVPNSAKLKSFLESLEKGKSAVIGSGGRI